jgi:nucleotide-binding universal stress UspA family protein
MQKLPFIAQFAQYFKSEVHIVTTHSSHLKSIQRLSEKNSREAVKFFENNHIRSVQDSIVSNDITKAVISYAVEINADIIAIMTERETPMNIMMGPQAQQLINQSPVPVLCIHPHEHF